MGANLIEQLRELEDHRTLDGRRHPLWLVLLFVIMGTMSGCDGYRALGDFVKRHRPSGSSVWRDGSRHRQLTHRALIETFNIQKHGVPSYSTIRRVVMGVDFEKFASIFNNWAKQYVNLDEARMVWH